MTFIPDTRNDDAYNQDFLNNIDKSFIRGYDYALETICNLFSGNLDVYSDELNEVCPEDHTIEEDEVFSKRDDLYEILEENNEIISAIIKNWLESSRDEIITSFIDSMDDKEYEELKAKAINSGKEYYDTRHYAVTGEKIDRNK